MTKTEELQDTTCRLEHHENWLGKANPRLSRISSDGIEAGDDEELRADREQKLFSGGRCGDEPPCDK